MCSTIWTYQNNKPVFNRSKCNEGVGRETTFLGTHQQIVLRPL